MEHFICYSFTIILQIYVCVITSVCNFEYFNTWTCF